MDDWKMDEDEKLANFQDTNDDAHTVILDLEVFNNKNMMRIYILQKRFYETFQTISQLAK